MSLEMAGYYWCSSASNAHHSDVYHARDSSLVSREEHEKRSTGFFVVVSRP